MNKVRRAELEAHLVNIDEDKNYATKRSAKTLVEQLLRGKTDEELKAIADTINISFNRLKNMGDNTYCSLCNIIKLALATGFEITIGRPENTAVIVRTIDSLDTDIVAALSDAVSAAVHYYVDDKDAVNEGVTFIKNRISPDAYARIVQKREYSLNIREGSTLDTIEKVLYSLGICVKIASHDAEPLPLTDAEYKEGFAGLSFVPHNLTTRSRVYSVLTANIYNWNPDKRVVAFALNYMKVVDFSAAVKNSDPEVLSYLLCGSENYFGCRVRSCSTIITVTDDNFENAITLAKNMAIQRMQYLTSKFGKGVFEYLGFNRSDVNMSPNVEDYIQQNLHPEVLATLLYAMDVVVRHEPANYPKHLAKFIEDLAAAKELYRSDVPQAYKEEHISTIKDVFNKDAINAIEEEELAQHGEYINATADAEAEKDEDNTMKTIKIPELRKDKVTDSCNLQQVFTEVARQFYGLPYNKKFKVGNCKFRFIQMPYGAVLDESEAVTHQECNSQKLLLIKGLAVIEDLPLAEAISKGDRYVTWFPMVGIKETKWGENAGIDAFAKKQGWIFTSKEECEKTVTTDVQQDILVQMMTKSGLI